MKLSERQQAPERGTGLTGMKYMTQNEKMIHWDSKIIQMFAVDRIPDS